MVLELIEHIKNPCVNAGRGCATRFYYLETARTTLPNLTNKCARGLLERAIQDYSG